ncbi:S-adenosylmethionine decarboxylase [Candidatus Kaiserbacteria bacterium]|nr:S-adenosylmethionine decarboxylase [Candidatus Kaiserbacteria bacterium]
MPASHFGEHVTIDGYGGAPELLDSEKTVSSCFDELCTLLGMRQLINPVVISAPDNHLKDPGGWSGFVIIAESHISIHTFPRRRFLTADIYSCKNGLDQESIQDFFKQKFQLASIETNFIKRGLAYPDHNLL